MLGLWSKYWLYSSTFGIYNSCKPSGLLGCAVLRLSYYSPRPSGLLNFISLVIISDALLDITRTHYPSQSLAEGLIQYSYYIVRL